MSKVQKEQVAALIRDAGQAIQAGRIADADAFLRRAVKLAPKDAAIWCNLGMVSAMSRRHIDAIGQFGKALALSPDLGAAHVNLARVLFEVERYVEAEKHARRALALAPNGPVELKMLADVAVRRGRTTEGAHLLNRALAIRPDWVDALNSLASVHRLEGRPHRAVELYGRCLAIKPLESAARNLVLTHYYDTASTPQSLAAAVAGWVKLHAHLAPLPAPANDRDPDRRLKIGYVSADLRNHPVAGNIEDVLAAHDRQTFEIFVYSLTAGADQVTQRLAGKVDHWRQAAGVSDAVLARQIRDDGIDILIILAGWTGDNRLRLAALRPAPLQVSWHDFGTSGLAGMDGWITDAVIHPPGQTGEEFGEELLRLPCFYYEPRPESAPEVAVPPCLTGQPVTFGSFNHPVKMTDASLALWAETMQAVPGSRLLLKYRDQFGETGLKERYVERFGALGIGPERLLFRGDTQSEADHLAAYAHVDIGLDPFPFNGSTTTWQALYMGVPVVTLAGSRFVGRVGLSLLTALGLPELAATTPADFVKIAVALANDPDRLGALRAGMRARIESSALVDAPGYARALEAVLRDFWRRRWCQA
ncbi:MAG: tetratricopeptide repeat protein [Alphaproteobacteria bacterium]|nr:tetratricopeptide repeat protein [Alphaproteobacteria bacterium]